MKVAIGSNGRVHRIIGTTTGVGYYVVNNNQGTYQLDSDDVVIVVEVEKWLGEDKVRAELVEKYPEYFI